MKYTDKYWSDVNKSLKCIPDLKKIYGKSIFITGATGMICSAIVDLLILLNKNYNAGIKIIVAGRNYEKVLQRFCGFTEDDGLYFINYDATSYEGIETKHAIDYIIHGASNANPAIYLKEPVETIMANIVGLERVLKLAKDKQTHRLLYISSSEVYGKKESLGAYKESDYGYVDILNQRAGYPCAKRAGESLCVAYGIEYNIDTVIVRPGHIYGPTITDSDNRASAQFTRDAICGRNIIMKSRGLQMRSYCHTVDCATAILAVLMNGKTENAYNISNPQSICTISEIAHEIATAAGVEVVYDIPSEDEKKSYNLMDNSSLNSEKLEDLGWKPMITLEYGVKSMIEVLREKEN